MRVTYFLNDHLCRKLTNTHLNQFYCFSGGKIFNITSNNLETIHFEFGETWRVEVNETEFTYENGESYQVILIEFEIM
jgi:hypothetical protein